MEGGLACDTSVELHLADFDLSDSDSSSDSDSDCDDLFTSISENGATIPDHTDIALARSATGIVTGISISRSSSIRMRTCNMRNPRARSRKDPSVSCPERDIRS